MSMQHKFKVGVLMGGRSVEREVSFNSGRTICDHIDIDRYEIIPLFQKADGKIYLLPWKFLHRGKIVDFEHRLEQEAKRVAWQDLKALIDFVYIAVHGRFAEDGTLQGMLEVLGIPYLGSKVLSSALGMDKAMQKAFLKTSGILVPNDVTLTPKQINEYSSEQIVKKMHNAGVQFPCVVKPVAEGSSIGVAVVANLQELLPALKKAAWQDVTCVQNVLIEEKITGMEFTCIALKRSNHVALAPNTIGQWIALPITEVVLEEGSTFHDYEQKYMPGRATKITPARCSEKDTRAIQEICIRVSELLGLATFFRIDGFLTVDSKVVITDPNSLSGMGPASFLFHQAAEIGINHTQLINYLINTELEQYGLLDGIVKYQEKKMKYMNNEKMTKKRVAVLFGGDSHEREISLESGRNVCYKLSPTKYDAIPVFVDDQMNLYRLNSRLLVQNSTREIKEQVTSDLQLAWDELPNICDFVFIGLHGGRGENGCVQGSLEMLGLPYNGSGVLASGLCMDKFQTNLFLGRNGFDVPKSRLVSREEWQQNSCKDSELLNSLKNELSFPIIIKPHNDGCSMYVKKADDIHELEKLLGDYFKTEKTVAMVEQCIRGMELTCGVIGNDEIVALPPSCAVATKGVLSIEEKFLPGAGENQTPAPLTPSAITLVQETMKAVYERVGCKGYVRIDCFYQEATVSPTGNDRVVILEINSLPGLTPATCLFHQAAEIGKNPMELIDWIVSLGFELHSNKVLQMIPGVKKEKDRLRI